MSRKIPYARQSIGEEDIAAVVEVLRSDWLTQGPMVERFERSVAQYCAASHAAAVSSGTAALHLAYLALGIKPGMRVWTSPITFVATANAALFCGAQIDFVDVDPRTGNMSIEALGKKLARGAPPDLVVPVHMAGMPCDMAGIAALASRHGFRVVEDASHALGARHDGQAIGACRHSDAAVFSFHPVKSITTGEGGMVMSGSADLHEQILSLRTHGVTRDAARMSAPPDGPWSYEQTALGYNYRMTDLQAALGVSQMKRLDGFVARRRELSRRYDEKLAGLSLERPVHSEASAAHLYVIRVKNRKAAFAKLQEAGIGVQVHYRPVHLQPVYAKRGFKRGDFPNAEAYYEGALSLPLFPGLTDAQQDRVVDALKRIAG